MDLAQRPEQVRDELQPQRVRAVGEGARRVAVDLEEHGVGPGRDRRPGQGRDVLRVPAGGPAPATGRAVNVKKGQFLAPEDAEHIVGKLRSGGARGILLTERGTTFGYNNLVVDFRSIPTMRSFGVPVVFDATHSVQRPGGRGKASGGDPQHIATLARAAVAAGADAVFLEVHRDPARALSDGPNALKLELVADLLGSLREIHRLVRGGTGPDAPGRAER